ncbi:MAG TPA: glycoside hydrolase family 3 C-terminal domain-containing protein [Streptosporangiaceae bacterium]|nr:glycoside hydrolase family 3 C-terminal domain-containing protein [Streptosporangiaceae bacterium]
MFRTPFRRSRHRHPLRTPVAAAAVAALTVLSFMVPGSGAFAHAQAATCPWLNQSLSVSHRVQMLMSNMTLSNEITMVEGQGNGQPYVFYMAAQPSLCIPAMGLEDGPLGVGDGLTGVTELPAAVSLAATFDPSLASQYGQVIGSEEWGKGAAVNLGPTINIDRDPRWGRSFEAFTEDPYLNGAMGVAEIDGVQSTGEMSQVKHFAAYNEETNRNTSADNVIVSDRTLHEIYLPGFQAAVQQAKAASVMCAYSMINNNFACENPYLEGSVLRDLWGFPGFVTSDYAALHGTMGSVDGTDMEQPFSQFFGSTLQNDVQSGTIPKSVVDTMVSRILTEMFQFNLFNNPPTGNTGDTVTTPAHQAVATQVAEEGTVLLKNSGGTLPISASNGGTVAVIGPAASPSPTDAGGGSAYVTAPFHVTPLQGLQSAAGSGTSIVYKQGLPTDTSLPAVPSSQLSPGYTSGSSYSGTLTAPQTGTYVLAVTNTCSCYTPTTLSLNGTPLLVNPGTPPVSTYSASVSLKAGQSYSVNISGNSSAFTWGTPSALAPGINAAVAAAKSASTAVVVVSDDTESEAADRPDLNLSSAQNELVSKVAAANPHTVVVVDAGAPVSMPWRSHAAAIVDAWYPGESNGTALASVLYGNTDPGGHLPVTFPTSLSQVPASTPAQWPGTNGTVQYSEGLDVGYRSYDAQNKTPMFPFGYGLSYTSFSYSGLNVTANPSANTATATATVTNTGSVAGSDVAQLYLGDPPSAGEPPRQLKGFQRVTLSPGQSTTVTFSLTSRDLSYWNDSNASWVVPSGTFQVWVGDSSALANLPLQGSFAVNGSAPSTSTGQVTGYTGLCLDDRGAITTPLNPVQVYTCNGTTAQQWTVIGSTIHVLGQCLDVNGGGTANGTTVDLYPCNGTGAQDWVPQSNGSLVNPQSGACLDDTGFGGSGTQVQIWACTGNANQQWSLP